MGWRKTRDNDCGLAVNSKPMLDTSYDPFAQEPEYLEVNRQFVDTLPLGGVTTMLDLACGTCVLGGMMRERADGPLRIVGLDLSRESLTLAWQHLDVEREAAGTLLLEGSADTLPVADGSVDCVVMGNAIQLLDDKEALVSEVARVLVPGGFFAFNTSFYSGTYPPGTERVYVQWVQRALEELTETARREGIRRKRGSGRRAFSQPWLSREEYGQLLERFGFEIATVQERTVELTRHSFETIGAYSGCASVVLSGWPVDLASGALQRAAGPTLEAAGMDAVPRRWLEMIAFRT
jgi:ubiquinone/menaquinone biosynthesis C-methylase UbiE